MNKILSIVFFSFLLCSANAQSIDLETYATGFSNPLDITHAGDDRLFITEQGGKIKIIDASGTTLSTPFIDLASVIVGPNQQDERGLLGLAFHPDYENNGYFYVNYVTPGSVSKIMRYSRNATDPNLADLSSGFEILSLQQPTWNHNGGGIKFGPDGYLYIGFGDGGSGNDPWNNSQSTDTWLGKMLRIDVDNGSPYSIPADNPFVNDADVLDEIWAIGLRNPWRFSFDRLTGDLWIGDVGQNEWEEIDFQAADSPGGENYGWRCYEGTEFTGNNTQAECNGVYVDPIFQEQQQGFSGACSITGGFVYRGTQNPDLVGKYIATDLCTGDFYIISPDGNGGWMNEQDDDVQGGIASFGEAFNGEIYCCRHSTGQIYKVNADACAGMATTVAVTSEPCEGQGNGTVTIETTGGTAPYTTSPVLDLDNIEPGNYNITVTDDLGCGNSQSFTINELPLPAPTFTVNGSELTVDGTFTDYQWSLNGTELLGATDQTLSATENGDYSVWVTGANGCSNSSPAITVIVTDAGYIPNLEAFMVSPSPFDKDISVTIRLQQATDFEVSILDNKGERVFFKGIKGAEQFVESLDLKSLASGIYFVELKTNTGSAVKRIVKQ